LELHPAQALDFGVAPLAHIGLVALAVQAVLSTQAAHSLRLELELTAQMGLPATPVQCEASKHGTHLLVMVSHAGLPATPAQCAWVKHSTHLFFDEFIASTTKHC
jgi:hypothetical protein